MFNNSHWKAVLFIFLLSSGPGPHHSFGLVYLLPLPWAFRHKDRSRPLTARPLSLISRPPTHFPWQLPFQENIYVACTGSQVGGYIAQGNGRSSSQGSLWAHLQADICQKMSRSIDPESKYIVEQRASGRKSSLTFSTFLPLSPSLFFFLPLKKCSFILFKYP